MRKYLLIFLLLSAPVAAQQQPVNTSTFSGLPPAGTITGNELVPIDQLGVTKKATTSQLTLGSMVLGVPSGGTGMSTVGPNGTCLVSNGVNLNYQACGQGGGGSSPGGSTGSLQYNAGFGLFGGYNIGAGLAVVGNSLVSTTSGGATPSGAINDVQINNGNGNFAPLQADTQAAYAAHNKIASGTSYDPRDSAYGAICGGYNTFVADGTTTTFSYSIPFTGTSTSDNTNFFVFYEPNSGFGSATILTSGQFTVTGVNSGIGGTITLNSAPPSGNTLIVVHDDSAGLVAASAASVATGGYVEVPDGCTIYGSQSLGTQLSEGANLIGSGFTQNYLFTGAGTRPFLRVIAPTGFAPQAGINISGKDQQFFEGFEITSNVPGNASLGFLDVPVLIGTVGNNGAGPGGEAPGIIVQGMTFAAGNVGFGAKMGGNSQYIFSTIRFNNFIGNTAGVFGPLSDATITDNVFAQNGGFGSIGTAGGLVLGPAQGALGNAGGAKVSNNRFEFNLEGVVLLGASISNFDGNQFDANEACGLDLRTGWNFINVTGGWFHANATGGGNQVGNTTAGQDADVCINGSGNGLHFSNVNFVDGYARGWTAPLGSNFANTPPYVFDVNTASTGVDDVAFDGGDAQFVAGGNGASVTDFAIYRQSRPTNLQINLFGQAQQGKLVNGTSSGQVRGLPSNQWTGFRVVGDNSSNNIQITPLTNGWGQLVGNNLGVGPTYSLLKTNGNFDCDVVNFEIAPLQSPSSSNNIPLLWMPTLGDPTFGGGFYQQHLADNLSCHLGASTWMTVPDKNKVYAQALSGVTTTGSWVTSSVYGPYGYTTSTQSDAIALTATTNGGPVYLWYLMKAGDGGTFNYNLDGGSNTSIPTQGNNAFSFPNTGNSLYTSCCGGIPQTLGAVRIPVTSSQAHTVNVAVTSTTSASNTVTIFGIGTSPGLSASSKNPLVIQGGQWWSNNTYASEAAIFNTAYQSQAAQSLADGLGVLFANTLNYFNFSTDVMAYSGSGTSINNLAQTHAAQAFTGILQPVRSADGSIDPRDYGAACNTKYYGNGSGGGTPWLLSTTSGSPVVSLTSTSFVPYYWQPGNATQTGGGDVGKKFCVYAFNANSSNNASDQGPCTFIKSVNTASNTATLGVNMPLTFSSANGVASSSVQFGGYPLNPNDPSTATDDSTFFNAAGQAAILGGNKVHVPTNCLVKGKWPVANVLYEGDNAGLYYNTQNVSSDASVPPVATQLFCDMTTLQSDTPVCADVSSAPLAKFKNILMQGLNQFPYIGFSGLTGAGIGYGQTSGMLGPNTNIFTENMSYAFLPVGTGVAFGYNIQTNFTGQINALSLTVSSIDSTNMVNTYGVFGGHGLNDMLALGRTITGVGIPSGETITSVPAGGGPGVYGVSLSATTSLEGMKTVQNANGMSLKDKYSEYLISSIGINGDYTDSAIYGSICTGTFTYYCWYNGPNSGVNFGNGGNSWVGGRMEEIGSSAFVCDGCGPDYFNGTDFDFNGGYNIQTKGTNPAVQVTGGWMIGGGHCSGHQNTQINVGGSGASVSVDGALLGTNDFGSGCGGTTTFLFATATGSTLSNMHLSVSGGNTKGNNEGNITNLYNWANGVAKFYTQKTAGWPVIDTSLSVTAASSQITLGAITGGALSSSTSALNSTTTGTITLTLPATQTSWSCNGSDQATGSNFGMGATTSTSAILYSLGAVSTGDPIGFSCPGGN